MKHFEWIFICPICEHKESWHHANQKQTFRDGGKYWRKCYGIACQCSRSYLEYSSKDSKDSHV